MCRPCLAPPCPHRIRRADRNKIYCCDTIHICKACHRKVNVGLRPQTQCESVPMACADMTALHCEGRLRSRQVDRLPRGVALTDAAEREMRELAGLSAGHVKIGASATVGVYLVPDMIARFNASHPQVAIDLTVTNTEQVEAGLRDRICAWLHRGAIRQHDSAFPSDRGGRNCRGRRGRTSACRAEVIAARSDYAYSHSARTRFGRACGCRGGLWAYRSASPTR
jgi:hypothetical protein